MNLNKICQTFAGSQRVLMSPLKKEALLFGPRDSPSGFWKNTIRRDTAGRDAHSPHNSKTQSNQCGVRRRAPSYQQPSWLSSGFRRFDNIPVLSKTLGIQPPGPLTYLFRCCFPFFHSKSRSGTL